MFYAVQADIHYTCSIGLCLTEKDSLIVWWIVFSFILEFII